MVVEEYKREDGEKEERLGLIMMMYWLIEIMKVEWFMVCKKVKVVGEEEESGERSERSVLSLEESERLSER